MEAQVAKGKVEGGKGAGEGRRIWARARAAVGDSAWGALAGKGLLYFAGFALLAAVGSGRLRCLALSSPSRVPVAEAGAAPLGSIGLPPASAAPAPACRPDGGAGADAGGEASAAAMSDAGPSGGGMTPEGKVVLNRATEEDLRHLPGIGATRAKAILALRAKLSRFTRVEELLRVKGIGRRSMARLRPLVLVD
jgi:competence protein ComEA